MKKKFLIYLLGNFGSKFLSFLIIPLYTSFLSPKDFGEYDYWITIISLCSTIIGMQIFQAVYMEVISSKNDIGNAKEFINVGLNLIIIQVLFSLVILIFLNVLNITNSFYIWFIIILNIFNDYFNQGIARGYEKNVIMANSGVIQTVISISLTTVLLYNNEKFNIHKLDILFIGQSFGLLVSVLFTFFALKKVKLLPKLNISLEQLMKSSKMLAFALPLIPSTISWWVVNVSNRFIIVNYLGKDANGIYAMANKFPAFIIIINTIIITVWQDQAILTSKDSNKSKYYSYQLYRYIFAQFIAVIIFTIGFKIFGSYLLKNSFDQAIQYVPLLLFSTTLSGIAAFYGTFYISENDTLGSFFTTSWGAILSIIVNLILIDYLGLYASILSTIISFSLICLLRGIKFKRIIGIKFPHKIFYIYIVAFFTLYLLFYQSKVFF
ncbi:lipopolysaccharide biosynthesis protein [Gottfriedia sp. NPDC057948]|uniref:lipopolysaccharide biosynthesis protein n=1 Tax=Gottfriedia sp. NPDC057948 TaxID=3346287 RepID=UPI0036DE466A